MFSSCIVVTNLNIKPPSMQIVYNPGIFSTLIGRFMSHGLILVSFVERSSVSARRGDWLKMRLIDSMKHRDGVRHTACKFCLSSDCSGETR